MHRIALVALVALVALAVNALTGIGSASNQTTSVKVITGISFQTVLSPRQQAAQGEVKYALASCPAGTQAIAGGYVATGTYEDSPPSVITSAPVVRGWRTVLAQPGTGGGSATLTGEVICAKITYATIKTA